MNRIIPALRQRSGLPLMIIAGVLLVSAAAVVWLRFSPFDGRSIAEPSDQDISANPDSENPAEDQPVPEGVTSDAVERPAAETPVTAVKPEVLSATEDGLTSLEIASHYVVQSRDTLFDIAEELWFDPYLWPLLLQANRETVYDPDFLKPGQRIVVPKLVSNIQMTDVITTSHRLAYDRYRSIGNGNIADDQTNPSLALRRKGLLRLNDSRWVLYSGLRYNPDLLEDLAADLAPEDLQAVTGFVSRFGPPPAPPSR